MNRAFQNVLVTGGAGFIGSNFIRYLMHQPDFQGRIINYDLLTYAGNLANLDDVVQQYGQNGRYIFVRGDICNREAVQEVFQGYGIDTVVHFAAESHVDRSIHDPSCFVKTNVLGTQVLLDASEFVSTIQRRQGFMIACLEEIAYQQSWITAEQVLNASRALGKTEYGKYLKDLVE